MEQLFADTGNRISPLIEDIIIPFHNRTVDMPAIVINIVMRHQEREFFTQASDIGAFFIYLKFWQKCQYTLNNHSNFIAVCIIYHQLMAPGQLAFYHIYCIAKLIINIITVKPRK